MENISKILLYLMACSIQSVKPEEKFLVGADLEKLLQTAKAHSVSAMVCMALEKSARPPVLNCKRKMNKK